MPSREVGSFYGKISRVIWVMVLSGLLHGSFQFILFGGKGGVGKTTMAAAASLRFAKEYANVLIFTTDPAPSLGDCFDQKIGNKPRGIRGVKNLFAMEIDAKKVLEEFKKEYGAEILDIFGQGTYLADEEVKELFALNVPGLDEVMGLKKIMDFMELRQYQLYIVDTAPTGHTLRLLALPDLLDDWIKFLARLRWKYHAMVRQFSGEERVERADEFLFEMKKTVKRVQNLLRDPAKTEFIVVTIPEAMGVLETSDLIKSLKSAPISSHQLIINNIVPKNTCNFCRIRRKNQEQYINKIKRSFPHYSITEIMLQTSEIKGIARLRKLGEQLF